MKLNGEALARRFYITGLRGVTTEWQARTWLTVLVHLQRVARAAAQAAEHGLRVAGELQRQLHGLRQQEAAEEAAQVGGCQHRQGSAEADLVRGEHVANDQGTDQGASLSCTRMRDCISLNGRKGQAWIFWDAGR